MGKETKVQNEQEDLKSGNTESMEDKCDIKVPEENQSTESNGQSEIEKVSQELEAIKTQLNDKSKQCGEYFDMLQRTAAEFDNYKRRTTREKESIYSEAVSDTVTAFLPVVDSLERAIQAAETASDGQALKEGIELVFRQLKDAMKKLGVEEIKGTGEAFNPELHNAVMHIEDESFGENEIVEEFQKGYKLKDRVIRHSMVKVAN